MAREITLQVIFQFLKLKERENHELLLSLPPKSSGVTDEHECMNSDKKHVHPQEINRNGENTSMAINLHFMIVSKTLFYRWFPAGKAVEEVL